MVHRNINNSAIGGIDESRGMDAGFRHIRRDIGREDGIFCPLGSDVDGLERLVVLELSRKWGPEISCNDMQSCNEVRYFTISLMVAVMPQKEDISK